MPSLSQSGSARRLRRNSDDVHQTLANHYPGDPDPLFDMVDRDTVKIELPAAAEIAAQDEAARLADQGSGFVNPGPDRGHEPPL